MDCTNLFAESEIPSTPIKLSVIILKLLPNAGNSADTFAIYSPELANLAIELTKRLTLADTSGIADNPDN